MCNLGGSSSGFRRLYCPRRLGSILSPGLLLASSPLGFADAKPVLIAWLERKAEVWTPEAEDPEEGARHPGSGIGEESWAELDCSRFLGASLEPAWGQPFLLAARFPHTASFKHSSW